MADRQLQYLIKVVDEASVNIAKIEKGLQGLDAQNTRGQASGGAMGGSMLQMAAAFGIASTAVGLAQQALQFLNSQFDNSIEASKQYTSAFIGLSSVAAAFGESQDKARIAARDLAKDGLMTVTDAAQGLKNLLGSKFNLDESIQLMKAFKDSAAFNRQGTLEFGQAIVGATQGIKNQNSIMVDNVGITKNLSIILQEAGYSVMDLQRVTTDAGVRQALYNGLLREGAVFSGDAGRAADTLAGSQSQLNTAMLGLYNTVGQILTPSIILFNQEMTGAANSTTASLIPAMNALAKNLLVVTEMALMAGAAIKNAVSMLGAISNPMPGQALKGLTDSWDQYGKDVGKIYGDTQKKLNDLAVKGVGGFVDVNRSALNDMGNAVDKNGSKIADKLQQINDKIADITRNINKEVTAFTRNIAEATADFDRQIKDLVVEHRKAAEDLRTQISGLTGDFSTGNSDRLASHDENVTKIKEKYNQETEALRQSLSRQLANSKTSNEQLVKYFNAQIKAKDAARDKEIADEQAAFEKEQAKQQAEYDKKLGDLQKQLNTEMDIEKKHADDFAKFKDAVADDDITRAEQQFSRQMDQMKYQHDLRMAELDRELQEEQALKNKYMGTSVNTSSGYKATGSTNYQTQKPQSKSYSNQTINLTINNPKPQPMNQTIKNALPAIGWMLGS